MANILDDEQLSKELLYYAENTVWFFKLLGTDPDRARELLKGFTNSIPPDDMPYYIKGLRLFCDLVMD